MPRKAHTLTDEERRRRIEETAKEIGTSNDPKDFERAFRRVAPPKRSDEDKSSDGAKKK
jgi:hypothetical protein